MKRAILFIVLALTLTSTSALATNLGPIFLGVHFIPAVQAGERGRLWDVSLSLGLGVQFDGSNRIEVHALTDSHVTSLGATVLYEGRLGDRLSGGAGVTILWPFEGGQRLLQPLVEAYAHATLAGPVAGIRGELGLSFPVVTVVRREESWETIPLAELPSLSLAVEFDIAVNGSFQTRITLQPVILDTTQLKRPIGRLTDNLLILPSISGYALYGP